MPNRLLAERDADFQAAYLPWLVVRHFLSAKLTQELCAAMVLGASHGSITFRSLFDTIYTPDGSALGNWAIRPRPDQQGLGAFLQQVIRSIVWQGDHVPNFYEPDAPPDDTKAMEAISSALLISNLDLATVEQGRKKIVDVPPELEGILDGMEALSSGVVSLNPQSVDDIAAKATTTLQMPLKALAIKHLGDLSCDADRWDLADRFYAKAEQLLGREEDTVWQDLIEAALMMIAQSRATAVWQLQGPAAAHAQLIQAAVTPARNAPLFLINAALDTLTSQVHGHEDNLRFWADDRAGILIAPQLLDAHHLARAFEASEEGKHTEANRWFWAVLRRQIALGSTVHANSTKALFGCALIDEASQALARNEPESSFDLGLRLLLEGASPEIASHASWTPAVVKAYVTVERIGGLIARTARVAGTARERCLVAIELFKHWILALPPEKPDGAAEMLRFLASTALEASWSILSDRNLVRASFKTLQEVANGRPEFRSLAAEGVGEAIIRKLGESHIDAMIAAIETAQAFGDAFTPPTLMRVVGGTLATSARLPNGRGPWVLLRPLIAFLSSEPVKALCAEKPALRRGVYATLLRMGIENETEYTSLLFLLRDADPQDVSNDVDPERIQSIIATVRKHAAAVGSSAATANIMALLLAPAFAGLEGVTEAINALLAILRSASDGRASIPFANAYQPLSYLTDHRDRIANALHITEAELLTLIEPVFLELKRVWVAAAENPLIFAGFAIPARNRPNATLVHNWTFISIGFAKSLGRQEVIADAMIAASHHPLLADAMAVARAVRVTAGDNEPFDLEAIQCEGRDPFYAALGRRLILLRALPAERAEKVVATFLEMCFRLGPNGLDAAVFMAAVEREIEFSPSTSVSAYRQRANNDSALRLTLLPMLDSLAPQSEHTPNF